MYTSAGLLDVHARTHESLGGLLDHCEGFAPDALARELDGFGYPTVLLQLHHVIGAEQYWMGVLAGELLVEEDEADHASIAALKAFRERVAERSRAWLAAHDDQALSTPRPVDTYHRKQVEVVPAHVVFRTQTHAFQHQGQVAAMCRLLGRPVPQGLDFPLRAS